ncbi:MAG TPA: DNA mismatch repair protein MutS [Opitutae bacterium]|nr:DNA mismatch repair protein MutS [Opitutae bacterium]|tara:strand:+ start:3815 stop:6466 length:2652 start_codon:yes stop_codon:yes gene_type:complete
MSKKGEETPMMKQYREARESIEPDTLLLFRLGDFYEMFEIDAERGAALLGITLTKRHDMPMAGIPSHAAEGYLTKLLALGHKVAICDQLEPPKPGKLVKRGITRIITPGTVLEDGQLEGERNHFLLALELDEKGARASWLDLSTGKFVLTESARPHDFLSVLSSLSPKEVLVPEGFERSLYSLALESSFRDELERVLGEVTRTERPGFDFDQRSGAREVMESLGVMNLEGFGIDSGHPALGAAGAVLVYAQDVLRGKPGNLSRIEEFCDGEALLLDPATQRNLEIFRTTSQTRKGSLLDAMDQTVSPAGARLLERYLASPERDLSEIRRRQGCVAEFSRANTVVEELGAILRTGSDLERILGRLRNRLVRPRELGGLRATVRGLPGIRKILLDLGDDFPSIQALSSGVDTFDDLRELLDRALEEELPPEIKVDVKGEGGRVIRAGFDEDFDRLRELGSGGKKWIVDLEASEREKTGISNLKVKYNGAFGYFIEVTKANLHLVPDEYVRKQTMTNAERFYTEELRQKEKEIVNAEERAVAREQELFLEVVESALQHADSLARTAEVLAEIDLFASWGSIMRDRDYCLPEFEEGLDSIEIEQGRHPVVESVLKSESLGLAGTHAFVPNDCFLSSGEEQICLITGPNMAGKSTFIRQVALLALMAQVGSAVPAKACRMGLVDRIFSRVGAGDELARGNSTFMVEMNETANILNNCSSSSLIVLDEIGRGTSTYDGLSIAWAVIEHIHGRKEKGPKTLFATHYHELTKLADSLPRLRNFSVAVKEWNDEIIFMRQVTPGASERSFGIQVARLAGLPEEVVERSKEILAGLEKGERSGKDTGPVEDEPVSLPLPRNASGPSTQEEDHPPKPPARKPRKRQDPSQLELF